MLAVILMSEMKMERLLSTKPAGLLLAAQCSTLVPEPISSVFVVGDEGAGKSTLIKALTTEKKEGGRRGWCSRNVKVTGVRGKTAGVYSESRSPQL
jgi:ATPase subunit of ABC transporter with duplicated ATPase domains